MTEAGNLNMRMRKQHSQVSIHFLKGQMKKQNRGD